MIRYSLYNINSISFFFDQIGLINFIEKKGDMQKVIWGAPSFWIERFPLYWGID